MKPTFKKTSSSEDKDKNKEMETISLKEKKNTSDTIPELLQKQVCHEFGNERLFISMYLWCEEKGFNETGKFFKKHSLEERCHGMDFIEYMTKRHIPVNPPCEQPIERDFDSLGDMLKYALNQEIETTKMIRHLHHETLKTSDLAITIACKFLEEQIEEENLFKSILNLYKMADGSTFDFEMKLHHIV